MKNTFLVLVGILFLSMPCSGSSKYSFLHITGDDGLSQSNVKAILRDSYGFMWFGTKNGLNRYDGHSILQLNCDDLVAKRGNHNISALCEDKKKRLWVGTDRGVYIYDMMLDVFTIIDRRTKEGTGMDNWVSNIVSDSAGNIWVVIPDQGVFRCKDDEFSFYEITERNNFKKETPSCISVRQNGEVWIGTWGAGMFKYNAANDQFEQYKVDKQGNSLTPLRINSICEDSQGWLVMALQDGFLSKYNPDQQLLQRINYLDASHTFIRNAVCHGDEIWAGTHDGLYIVRESTGSVTHLQEDLMDPFSLSDNIIYTMHEDNKKGMWLGTMFGGVSYLPSRELIFEKYIPRSNGNSLATKRIREMVEDREGNIWIGTEDNGLNVLSVETNEIRKFEPMKRAKSDYSVLNLSYYQNQLYCGLYKQGLEIINGNGGVERHSDVDMRIEEGSVYTFYIDRKGQKWVGTGSGLFIAPENSFIFKRVQEAGYDWIFDILEDKDGTMWFASMGSGLWKHTPATGMYEKYIYREGEENCLSSNSVTSIMQDSRGWMWFSTDRGGICRYNPEKNNFITHSIKEGMPDDVSYKILEDKAHNLWFGTNKGLVKFNPVSGKIQVFTTKEGLLGNQFNYKSALKARDGKFYFGGINGLIAFQPEYLVDTIAVSSPIYISRFYIYNKEVTVHSPNSPLKKNIIGTKEIILPYNQANISFDVSLLDYSSSKANECYYKLEPVDENWTRVSNNQNNISYANLSPGRYTLRVKSSDKGSDLPTCSLIIVILPPWWASWWAYIGYGLILIGFVFGGFLWYWRYKDKQMKEQQALFEIKKEKELYESKVEFFTEIAHEVRTPLTLINGPLEVIREMNFSDVKLNKNLNVIAQNTNRLLNLASQLLDFHKLSSNKLRLSYESVNIAALLSETAERFEPTITQNNKILHLDIPDEPIMAGIDKEAVTKILSNLLNNALKYAHQEIWVELKRNETSFVVKVASDGEKIPDTVSESIFEPFYRMEKNSKEVKGVGIGLSLSRSLATLHNGQLYLDQNDALNTFVLVVPLNREEVIKQRELVSNPNAIYLNEDITQNSFNAQGCTILLVEDNEEMLDFITGRLSETFFIEIARNGQEALDLLKQVQIDIIVSDVMMPVMDGWELCRRLKADVELCHIPIIFLTAKNDLESKISGLKVGAEAYVEKPFSFEYLKMQIVSLLDNRRKEREAFSKRPFFPVHNMQINKVDEEFMNKVLEAIGDNLADENFNVERLADILCMSRSGLLRKLKILFNLSPVDFIRVIRLKKAAELIQTGEYRIGEICYMVGINTPSYFSRLFAKQFGITPKDFEKQSQSKKGTIDLDKHLQKE